MTTAVMDILDKFRRVYRRPPRSKDTSMPPVAPWLRSNVGTLITLALLMAAIIVQWANFGSAADLVKAVDQRQRVHELDSRRHVDYDRDNERWNDLMRRLDRIERAMGK